MQKERWKKGDKEVKRKKKKKERREKKREKDQICNRWALPCNLFKSVLSENYQV